MEDRIDIDDFKRIDLRVGTVLDAGKVEGSRKLVRLVVDIGDERRTVIAGIAEHYDPEELKDTQVVLVANLKPARIMGQESDGMILVAEDGKKLAVLRPDRPVKPGRRVS